MNKAYWLKNCSERRNTTAFFRIKLPSSADYSLKIASSVIFRVLVNGKLIGYGPRRTYGDAAVLNTYDLSPFHDCPEIFVTVEAVYYGCDSFYVPNEPPFVICDIFKNGDFFCDLHDFDSYRNENRVQKVPRYSWQRHFLECYTYSTDPSESYMGEVRYTPCPSVAVEGKETVVPDLPYPTFEKMLFSPIEAGGVDPIDYDGEYPIIKSSAEDRFSVFFPASELESDPVHELACYSFDILSDSRDRFYTYALSENKTGFVSASVTVSHDCDVYLVFDETVNDAKMLKIKKDPKQIRQFFDAVFKNGTLPLHFSRTSSTNIIKYSLKKGPYDLLTMEPYTMKYLRFISVGSDIEINRCALILYENSSVYDFDFDGSEAEKLVFRAAQSTLAQNSVDLLTDCPSRERTGWLCDSFFSSRAERLLTGDSRIERNLLLCYLHEKQRRDLPPFMPSMNYPSDHYNGKFIPNWAMFLYLELEQYVRATGDTALAEQFKGKAMGLCEYFRGFENSDGLLEDLDSWIFVEWSKCNDLVDGVNYPTNMLYCAFLSSLYALYDDAEMQAKAERIRAVIRAQSRGDLFYADHAVRKNGSLVRTDDYTETAQYYAFYFGIADRESDRELFDFLFDELKVNGIKESRYPFIHPSNMLLGDILRLDYLHRIGRKKQAADECLSLFGGMAEKTGTVWEFDSTLASCCHAFASVCVCWLSDCR